MTESQQLDDSLNPGDIDLIDIFKEEISVGGEISIYKHMIYLLFSLLYAELL